MNFKIGKKAQIYCEIVYENDYVEKIGKETTDLLNFKGELGQCHVDISKSKVYLSLGKKEDLDSSALRLAYYKLSKALESTYKFSSVLVDFTQLEKSCKKKNIKSIVEGFLYSEYSFKKYSSKKEEKSLQEVIFNIDDNQEEFVNEGIAEAILLLDSIKLTRDLINTPAMDMYPEILANIAVEELKNLNVEVEVLGIEEIKKLGMTAFLSVAQGSAKEPKFIIMNYKGNKDSDQLIAFVGKGLTYDSGGYSIKPTSSMITMQSDMSGAATVIGAIKAIASAKLPTNIVGVVAACENMISGDAYKPGDVVGSMSGKTIEIGNTDAEGRVTLADSLYYTASKLNPDYIIDLATLTGACVVSLGDLATGAVTNNKELLNSLLDAAKKSDENIWELPNFKGYKKYIKSDIADLSNVGKINGAGAITAGLFLGEFVEDIPWVHLDIAGTAFLGRQYDYFTKGATGYHVKTLYYFAKCASEGLNSCKPHSHGKCCNHK